MIVFSWIHSIALLRVDAFDTCERSEDYRPLPSTSIALGDIERDRAVIGKGPYYLVDCCVVWDGYID